MKIITYLIVIFLTGCTTLDDFKAMSAEQRAIQVCNKQPNIVPLASERDSYKNSISSAHQALALGYRVHRQCYQVEVYGDAITNCRNFGSGIRCTEYRPKEYQTQCNETPVSIDTNLEQSNIQSWTDALKILEARLNTEYNACYQNVLQMSAEEAYKYY